MFVIMSSFWETSFIASFQLGCIYIYIYIYIYTQIYMANVWTVQMLPNFGSLLLATGSKGMFKIFRFI